MRTTWTTVDCRLEMQILILPYNVKQARLFQPSLLDQTVSIWLYMTLYMNQMPIFSNKQLSGWLEGSARRLRTDKALSVLMVKLVSARFSTFPSSVYLFSFSLDFTSPYMHIRMNKTKALHTQVCMYGAYKHIHMCVQVWAECPWLDLSLSFGLLNVFSQALLRQVCTQQRRLEFDLRENCL